MRVKPEPVKMTEAEKKEWDELYEYVKKQILFYDDNQNLSSYICTKLKGIRTGKFIENRNIKDQASIHTKSFYIHFRYADQKFWLHYLGKHLSQKSIK